MDLVQLFIILVFLRLLLHYMLPFINGQKVRIEAGLDGVLLL